MSNFRERARAVRAEGAKERGNFEPTGAPKRIYNRWLENSGTKRAERIRSGQRRENFCHFWRVVLFWAPLQWLVMTAERVVTSPIFLAVAGILAVLGLIFGSITWSAFATAVGFSIGVLVPGTLLLLGLFAGTSLNYTDDEINDSDFLMKRKTARWFLWVPTTWLSFVLVKFFSWRHAGDAIFIAFMGAALIVAIIATILSFIDSGFWVTLLYFAGAIGIFVVSFLVIAGLLFFGEMLSDYIAGRRKRAQEDYESYVQEYVAEHGELPEPKPASRLRKTFASIGDFFIFAAQIVRVKKWKICPTVEINK